MKDYPYSLVIKYKKGNVRYKIGNAIEVTYWIREYTNYFVKIAPHWNYYFNIHVLHGDE